MFALFNSVPWCPEMPGNAAANLRTSRTTGIGALTHLEESYKTDMVVARTMYIAEDHVANAVGF